MFQSSVENRVFPQKDRVIEGDLTHRFEQRTAGIPIFGFFGLALVSMVISAILAIFVNRKEFANFIGLWAPSFLLMGIYNKLLRLEGVEPTPMGVRHEKKVA